MEVLLGGGGALLARVSGPKFFCSIILFRAIIIAYGLYDYVLFLCSRAVRSKMINLDDFEASYQEGTTLCVFTMLRNSNLM